MNSFIHSQFSYCPLLWMFCYRESNRRINHIHEKGLRMVYHDYTSYFKDLLIKDRSVCIHHKNIRLVVIEMYKAKNKLCTEILKDLFNLNPNPRSGKDFFIPNVNTVFKGEYNISNKVTVGACGQRRRTTTITTTTTTTTTTFTHSLHGRRHS